MQKSNRNRTAYTGWLAAALVVGIVAGTGFQSSMKIGSVDLGRVITETKIRADASARVQVVGDAMNVTLDYMKLQKFMTEEQCERKRILEFKQDRSAVEEVELQAIKDKVADAIKEYDGLITKSPLTDEDRDQIDAYNTLKLKTDALRLQWEQAFKQEFQTLVQLADREMLDLAMKAAQDAAKQEGYTLVFPMTSIVYAANDVTDKAIELANK